MSSRKHECKLMQQIYVQSLQGLTAALLNVVCPM